MANKKAHSKSRWKYAAGLTQGITSLGKHYIKVIIRRTQQRKEL